MSVAVNKPHKGHIPREFKGKGPKKSQSKHCSRHKQHVYNSSSSTQMQLSMGTFEKLLRLQKQLSNQLTRNSKCTVFEKTWQCNLWSQPSFSSNHTQEPHKSLFGSISSNLLINQYGKHDSKSNEMPSTIWTWILMSEVKVLQSL